MNRTHKLNDSQLLTLASSKVKLGKTLRREIKSEVTYRELQIPNTSTQSKHEKIPLEWKFVFLIPVIIFPLSIIPMALAATYLGRGEIHKYKEAWRITVFSDLIYLILILVYFIFQADS